MQLQFSWKLPGTVVQVPPVASQLTGTMSSWTNLANVQAIDGQPAFANMTGVSAFGNVVDREVFLMISGVTMGLDRNGDAFGKAPSIITIGTTGTQVHDTWRIKLTPAIVNDPSFGFQWAAMSELPGTYGTWLIQATNFNFNLPVTADILNMYGEINGWFTGTSIFVDWLSLTIQYMDSDGIMGISTITL